ncbi:MAG: cation:proton antiporter, partial [Nitrospirota bacterium]|nr:cation:proton antiporter [Nitrospirota bacterium]
MRENLLIVFIVIGGAAVIPFFARKFRVPSAALEIIYGIALFNAVITVQPDWFMLLKELGLIFLMFIAGMELDIRKLAKGKRFYWYIVISLFSLLFMPYIFHRLGYPFYLGVAVSVISAGIVVPVLKEMQIIDTDFGCDVIGIALTGELLSIILLMGIDVHHKYGLTLMAALEGAKLVLLTALAALFLRVLYIIAWWNPGKVERVMESDDPVEEGIRAVIFIAFAGALIAHASGLEPILGSFLAGLVFSCVFKSKGRFEDKINAVGFGFFTPFFFIGVGADFNVMLLSSPDNIYLSLFLTVMVLGSNIFPLLFSHFMKTGALDALGMSLVISAPLSLM